ncbi:MAG TPA: hypothetical protein VHK69_09705, partial [Chitinophagaceae bacterium]|nr:hypothetical protein [Chitinophagaceae bacterium]
NASEAAQILYAIGERKLASTLEQTKVQAKGSGKLGILGSLFGSKPEPWMHTAHTFGFLPMQQKPEEEGVIVSAGKIQPDEQLKNGRIKVTLNRLRVASYPGKGEHSVLFDFYARNQTKEGGEDVHFNATFRVREGSEAGIVGYPIFLGLNVGTEGVSFKCFTVNVKNKDDEKFLGVLESSVFKKGLQLATTVQPALAPLSELAVGITKSIATRNRNVAVQDFYMGLDFGGARMGARLAQGDYIAVQIPANEQTSWRWKEWKYDADSGHIRKITDGSLIPFNYIVFGVSKF